MHKLSSSSQPTVLNIAVHSCADPQAKILPTTYGYEIDGTYMSIVMIAGSLGNVFFVMIVAQLFGARNTSPGHCELGCIPLHTAWSMHYWSTPA